MTKLLEQAIAEIRKLPEKRQDEAAEVLLGMAVQDPGSLQLTKRQIAEVKRRLQDPNDRRMTDAEAKLAFQDFGV